MSTALAVVAIGTAVEVGLVAALRLGTMAGLGEPTPESLVPVLSATALLCAVGLTSRRDPTVAWLAAIAAASILTLDLASVARVARPTVDAVGWRWLSIVVGASALLASAAAVAYAADPARRLGRWVVVAGVLALGWVLGVAIWATADAAAVGRDVAESPLGSLRLVTRSFLVVTVGFVALGLLGDARPSWHRARRRVAVERPAPSGVEERIGRLPVLVRAWVDEVAPGRSRARREALAERSRIARDLHADVVPALRRAVSLAEDGASLDRLAASLRDALDEVEALSTTEHSIQLDIGGIVRALESLAERTEERSGVRVTLDVLEVAGSRVDGGQPPVDVAAAAFRVAGLSLDNVARHAPGANVVLEVLATASALRLVIADDGPGVDPAARVAALADGRRGLIDMVTEALACGATVEVGPRDGGRGTVVRFAWPAP